MGNAESERDALWELIEAIDWIRESWSTRELSDAVNNAAALASEIAQKFPHGRQKEGLKRDQRDA